MILDYILIVYGVIAIWGIPYAIVKQRNHPHTDAIGAATWVCLRSEHYGHSYGSLEVSQQQLCHQGMTP